jgi:hypothetical protein
MEGGSVGAPPLPLVRRAWRGGPRWCRRGGCAPLPELLHRRASASSSGVVAPSLLELVRGGSGSGAALWRWIHRRRGPLAVDPPPARPLRPELASARWCWWIRRAAMLGWA